MKKLFLTSFERVVQNLEKAIQEPTESYAAFQKELYRDAVIQRFEYTYELAWKFIRRTILDIDGDASLDQLLTKHDLFRKAAELRLLEDSTVWMHYHEARNITSHIYDEEVARRVFDAARKFCADARVLLTVLQTRYGA